MKGSAMKSLTAVTAVLALCASAASAQSTSTADMDAVRKVDVAWAEAFRACNLKTMGTILDDDLVFIVQSGIVHTKKEQLASVGRCDMKEMRVEPARILVFGDTALVHGTMQYRLEGARASGGKLLYGRAYVRRSGTWRMVQHQSTIAASPR
jgi:ketosteroid isomerase-like protein